MKGCQPLAPGNVLKTTVFTQILEQVLTPETGYLILDPIDRRLERRGNYRGAYTGVSIGVKWKPVEGDDFEAMVMICQADGNMHEVAGLLLSDSKSHLTGILESVLFRHLPHRDQ